jgi:two-component system, OmpR family, sensor histidine kinase SenX3
MGLLQVSARRQPRGSRILLQRPGDGRDRGKGMRVRPREALSALERRQAQTEAEAVELQAERDRLTAALDALTEALVVVDGRGQIVARNASAQRFVNARHGDALAEAAVERLLAAALAGYTRQEEVTLVGPPSQHLLVQAQPLLLEGAVNGAVASVRDISELRRVEQVRRDFVANVSHELKTPIGALAVLAETIAGLDDVSSDSAQALADRMVREADRLAQAVDELLDLSTIESEDQPRRETVSLRSVIEAAVERVSAAATARRVPVQIHVPDEDVTMVGDDRQLTSAVANLIDNSVKYSEADQPTDVTVSGSELEVVIEVRDRGIGIPARDLERIFERFYRVDRARSRDTGGTGLGLSIVRHVAEGHGGRVTVESVEGEGSTFRVVLPTAAVSAL